VNVPWFPDFTNAAELARRSTRATGQADPVRQYLRALDDHDARALQEVWPAEIVVHDPRAGEVRGHRQLRRFVSRNQSWLAGRHARVEIVSTTKVGRRAVVELLAHLDGDGREGVWPVAVVAESPDDRSVVFRTYCSQWLVDGHRHLRPPVLEPADVHPGDVVGRHLTALAVGDVEAVVGTFAATGYLREPVGAPDIHRGRDALRGFYSRRCGPQGGITLQHCCVTDDGVRCVLEYNCVSWAGRALPPQAGVSVYERDQHGKLAAVRVYDDVEAPVASG
jgi:limonene-1,2-epoxide hydrolase